MPVRVLLDATAIPADRGGVGRYVDGLAIGYRDAGLSDRLAIVCQRGDAAGFAALSPGATILAPSGSSGPRAKRLAWEQVALPLLARRVGADVLHSPHYTFPLASPCPVVVTLHDATFFTARNVHQPVKARFFRTWTRLAVRRAAGIVVPSDATRREVLRVAGGDPATMIVVHHGVDPAVFRPPSTLEMQRFEQRLGLHGQSWIAFLGTLEPRKNVPNLIRGFVQAVRDRVDPPVLVLAGGRGWDEQVDAAVATVPRGVQVLRPGYLRLEDLPALLGGAQVVAYPALGEGFGLPVLEAMACGAAVLTTARLALPEVGGEAVAYAEPDAPSIGAALANLLDDDGLRRRLRKRALQRAADFSWRACAERHYLAFEKFTGGTS
jgi:glycosyltransferase involved in cell wall biosynthesis